MSAARAPRRHVAVIGAGWAGIAAAVELVHRGARITLLEMAHRPGGRARCSTIASQRLDNGQHILVGAYVQTLALMRRVGVDPARTMARLPLALCGPDGRGLRLSGGHPVVAFARGVLGHRDWPWADRLALLLAATGWLARGFRCPAHTTVSQLCAHWPRTLMRELVDPLCVAALNTPSNQASAQVFLRVLQDALFGVRGGADLILPRVGLDDLLPQPAMRWLADRGADLGLGRRVMDLVANGAKWQVDGESFDAVVLACSAREAGRLTAPFAPAWSERTCAFTYEPIVTVYLRDSRLRLPLPMVALRDDALAPAQFAFDLGALGVAQDLFSFVVSGARRWTERGLRETALAVLAQARRSFPGAFLGDTDHAVAHVRAEHRATFACTPGLLRPPMLIADGLLAAGDYVEGPYPATLEGAVRSGLRAALALAAQ